MCDDIGNKYSGVYYFSEEKKEIGESLKLTHYNANINIVDCYSIVEIEQIFVNEKDNQESIVIIPIDEIGAKIFSFTVEIDGERVKNPKPIEKQPTNLYLTCKAFTEILSKYPFYCKLPSTTTGKEIKVNIGFVQKLEWIEERFSFLFPSAAWGKFETKQSKLSFKERLNKKLTKSKIEISSIKFKMTLDIEMHSEILSLESNISGFNIKKDNRKANLQFTSTLFPESSVFVYFKIKDPKSHRIWCSPIVSNQEIQYNQMMDDNSVLMYTMAPNFESKVENEVIFLVDNSISIKENGFSKITKKILDTFIKILPNDCPFNIATFGDEPIWLFNKSEPKNKKSISKASKYVSSLKFKSKNTILSQILEFTFDFDELPLISKLSRQLVIITDGYISDPININEIKKFSSDHRIFVCGLGTSAMTLSNEICLASKGTSILLLNTDGEKEISTKVNHLTNQIFYPAPPLKTLDVKSSGNPDTFLDVSQIPSICQNEQFTFFHVVQNSTLSQINGEVIIRTGESLIKFDLTKKSEFENALVKKIASYLFAEELCRGTAVREDRKKRRIKFAENFHIECGKFYSSVKSEEQLLLEKNKINSILEKSNFSTGSLGKDSSVSFLQNMMQTGGTGLSKVNTYPQPKPFNRNDRIGMHKNLLKQVNEINNPSFKSFEKVTKLEIEGILLHKIILTLRDTFKLDHSFSLPLCNYLFTQSDLLHKLSKITFQNPPVPVSQLESMSREQIGKTFPTFKEKNEGPLSSHSYSFSCVSFHAERGLRDSMEDAVVYLPHFYPLLGMGEKNQSDYFGVFDGHSGFQAADFSQQQLHIELKNQLLVCNDMKEVFNKAFITVNERFNKLALENNVTSGTTATSALVDKEKLYVANVGDSEGFLFEDGKVIPLTMAHNPSVPSEKERLEKEGAKLFLMGNHLRVGGTLAVSRSIGDPKFEPHVTAVPHFYEHTITPQSQFLVVASDGLWDVLKPDNVCEIISKFEKREDIAKHLVEKALELKSTDNISVFVGFF